MFKAATLAVLFFAGAQAQSYQASALNLTSWTTVNVPSVTCTKDADCAYLGNKTYSLANACCATWKSQPIAGGNVTVLGNSCITEDIDFFSGPMQTSTSNVWFNCTINSTWTGFVAQAWKNVNSTGCTMDSQCGTG